MTKRILLLLLVAIPLFSLGQTKFLEINNDIKKGGRNVKASYPIVNDDTGEFAIFLDDNKKIYGFLFNDSNKQIGKISTDGLPNRYKEIIGYSISLKKIRLFLKSQNNKTFGSVLFDFDTGETIETIYDFKLKDEIYLEGYNHNQTFYLITISKNSSLLNFYAFEENHEMDKKVVDLSAELFLDKKRDSTELSDIMFDKRSSVPLQLERSIEVGKIDVNSPNSLTSTSKLVKIYPAKDKLTLTIDTDSLTYVTDFSIPSLSYELNSYSKTSIVDTDLNSNSFILKDKIYLISATKSEMIFTIKDLDTRAEIRSIHLKKDDSIEFKNTPIIQEGGLTDSYREMEKTSKFLRRIATENIGVSVLEVEDGYVITMGSELMGKGGMAMMPQNMGIPIWSAGSFVVTFNPTFVAYGDYKISKATRIECLFDKNYDHVEGTIPENVFDRINKVTEKIVYPDAENVFKIRGKYIWGYYNNPANKFILFEF